MARVASHLRKLSGPLVVCGDFNIIHESIAMRPLDFLTDLTHEHGIKNTLTGLKFNGSVACDHILVNDQVSVKDFQVLDAVVSDHKALMPEIDIA
jgi:endonuclease/exonuclease/phosphatase family metal-dependent hydrolase